MDEQDDIHTAYAKLYKVSEKYEKLYRLATKKLSDVEVDRKELFKGWWSKSNHWSFAVREQLPC